MIAHTELIIPTIELALENKQLQPVIKVHINRIGSIILCIRCNTSKEAVSKLV